MSKQWRHAAAFSLSLCATTVRAAVFPIPCTGTAEDANDIAAAIDFANDEAAFPGDDTIVLSPSCHYTLTTPTSYWYGPDAFPPIQSSIFIEGHGAVIARDTTLPSDTSHAFRLFYVSGGLNGELAAGTLHLHDMTLAGGIAKGGDSKLGGGGAGMGGAIFNQGTLELDSITLSGNGAQGGSTHVGSSANGGGMGADGGQLASAGGFGGALPGGPYGGLGAPASNSSPNGGGGGFTSDNGNAGAMGLGGGLGALGGSDTPGDTSDGGRGNGTGQVGIIGGNFGEGGTNGGGGGVGGGGSPAFFGGSGGFGGGGGSGNIAGAGGFGAGSGAGVIGQANPGFGGGRGTSGSGSTNRGGAGAGMGGAIFNHAGSVTLTNCTVAGNQASGGVANAADTIGDGGGLGAAIFNLNGTVVIDFSTIAQNVIGRVLGPPSGSGVGNGSIFSLAYGNRIQDGTASESHLQVSNSIVYGTIETNGADDDDVVNNIVLGNGPLNTGNHATLSFAAANVIGSTVNSATLDPGSTTPIAVDPQLEPLAANDVPTAPQTMAIGSGSVALDAATGACPAKDERGLARPAGAACDIGAYERGADSDSIFIDGFDTAPPK
jgi:hypothetical protein